MTQEQSVAARIVAEQVESDHDASLARAQFQDQSLRYKLSHGGELHGIEKEHNRRNLRIKGEIVHDIDGIQEEANLEYSERAEHEASAEKMEKALRVLQETEEYLVMLELGTRMAPELSEMQSRAQGVIRNIQRLVGVPAGHEPALLSLERLEDEWSRERQLAGANTPENASCEAKIQFVSELKTLVEENAILTRARQEIVRQSIEEYARSVGGPAPLPLANFVIETAMFINSREEKNDNRQETPPPPAGHAS